MRQRTRCDAGVGTVLALAVISSVLLAAAGVAALGTARVVRHRAAVAADGAALAAATAALDGQTAACALARRAASLAGARLVSCRVAAAVADVQVEQAAPTWLPIAGVARLNARAGPADTQKVGANRDKAARPDHPS